MATVTDPIMLDSTGQAIKNSIDLLSANINRTASNIPYDSNLTIKGKIDAIDLTSGGTIDGALQIHGNTVVENSGTTDSYLLVGGSTSRGFERIYKNGYYTQIYHQNNLTANRELYLPDKTGTIALTSDLVQYKDHTFSGLTNSDNTKYYINLTTDFYTALNIPSNKIVIGVTVLTWSGSNKTPPVVAIDGTALAWVFPVGHTFTNAQIRVRIAYF